MSRLNDYDAIQMLLDLNEINYNTSDLYNEFNNPCGFAIWLDDGHFEFNTYRMLSNVVLY